MDTPVGPDGSASAGLEEPLLSTREHEVLHHVLKGKSNKQIAADLFVCEKTVKFHVSNILKKRKVRSRERLIILEMEDRRANPTKPRFIPASHGR